MHGPVYVCLSPHVNPDLLRTGSGCSTPVVTSDRSCDLIRGHTGTGCIPDSLIERGLWCCAVTGRRLPVTPCYLRYRQVRAACHIVVGL